MERSRLDTALSRTTPERRREPRLLIMKDVTVKVLGWVHAPPPRPASVLDVSGSGMRLLCGYPLPAGVALEIQSPDAIALGEVTRCTQEPEEPKESAKPSFVIGVRVSQILSSQQQLEELNYRLQAGPQMATQTNDEPQTVPLPTNS